MSQFRIERSTTVAAEPADVLPLLVSFHEWRGWSPWEDVDPDMTRTYSGPDAGVGARYAWSGNRRAGAGAMTITDVAPEGVAIDLDFERPFATSNRVLLALAPDPSGTRVTWSMTGERTGIWGVVGRLLPMDRLVGRDFEKGLDRLKALAEGRRRP